MRHLLLALPILLCTATATNAEISVGINMPGISIGINVPVYPRLVQVPGYPVYYDPRADSNYFFYDGLYWVYRGDNWYESSWYNGPWQSVDPIDVPLFVLRVPVRYYRQPPTYFSGWRADAAPRWGDHWGREWEGRRSGWDQWNRRSTPRAAPLPVYQRQYSGNRYPLAVEQQQKIQSGNYRYQPRDAVTQQHIQRQPAPGDARTEQRSQAPPQQRQVAQPQPVERRPAPARAQEAPPRQAQPPMQQRQAEPQDKGRNNKAGPKNQGRDKENEDRGNDRW